MSSEPDATRVALVTGSGGIGRDDAIRLATAGFRVVVNYAGHVAEADPVIVMLPIPGFSSVTHLEETSGRPSSDTRTNSLRPTLGLP